MFDPSPSIDSSATGPDLHVDAYRTGTDAGMSSLALAPSNRRWMKDTRDHFASRCLPLRVANQAGWFVLNNRPFVATWDGGRGRSSLKVSGIGDHPCGHVTSIFGHGILSFHLSYLFRTSPGYNLLVRGPANLAKDGISPLEGLVETDWSVATFTMNWQMTRPGLEVGFEAGEPVCMIVPQRRGELESFQAHVRDLDTEPELAEQHRRWDVSRRRHTAEIARSVLEGVPLNVPHWELDYTRGTSPGGASAEVHQTRLQLAPFVNDDTGAAATLAAEEPDKDGTST